MVVMTHRFANLYFLLTASLALIPDLTPIPPLSNWLPLIFVLSVSAIKEAYEDYQRYKADIEANSAPYTVFRDGREVEVPAKDIVAGDLVMVKKGQFFPADLIGICSSDSQGLLYIQTANLDGETNLKRRYVVHATQCLGLDATPYKYLRVRVECEDPNQHMYNFVGRIIVQRMPPPDMVKLETLDSRKSIDGRRSMDYVATPETVVSRSSVETTDGNPFFPLGPQQLLLRGSQLRNTHNILGLALYTGANTKLSQNHSETPSRFSKLEKKLNSVLIFIFIFFFACVAIGGVGAGVWAYLNTGAWYMPLDVSPTSTGLTTFFSYWILLSYMIPISLYVTVEVTRVFQVQMMEWDIKLRGDPDDEHTHMRARNSNTNEEMGQVEHVFSDKTGTLTMNEMILVKWSINGRIYDQNDTTTKGDRGSFTEPREPQPAVIKPSEELQEGAGVQDKAKEKGHEIDEIELQERMPESTKSEQSEQVDSSSKTPSVSTKNKKPKPFLKSISRQFSTVLSSAPPVCRHLTPNDANYEQVRHMMWVVSLCHTVVTEVDDGEMVYNAESPDEEALLIASAQNGVEVVQTIGPDVHVAAKRGLHSDPALGVQDIENCTKLARKDGESFFVNVATVVATLEFSSDRKRMSVIARGSDGKLYLLTKGADSTVLPLVDPSDPILDSTKRHLDDFACEGLRTLVVAERVVDELEFEAWHQKLKKAEASLHDRAGKVAKVCNEIEHDLRLIGCTAVEDKLQDRVPQTIKYLLEAGIHVWLLTGDKQETAINVGYSSALLPRGLPVHIINAKSSNDAKRLLTAAYDDEKLRKDQEGVSFKEGAVVIDGATLKYVLDSTAMSETLLSLGQLSMSVIVCRATPMQKAMIVRLAKENLGRICLAIGDGANDVSMIQEANVGLGIIGKEGTQAARASDYAIHQFKDMQRLLTVHGRWSYYRLAYLVQYAFYKFLFGFWSGFSAQALYDPWLMTFWNVFFTSLPPFVFGIFEKDLPDDIIDRHPKVAVWLIAATYHGLICWFIPYAAFDANTWDSNGLDVGMHGFGITIITIVVTVVLLKAALEYKHWTWISHVTIWGSLGFYVLIQVMYSLQSAFEPSQYWLVFHMTPIPSVWLLYGVTVVAALLPDYAYKAYRRTWRPKDYEILQEMYRGDEGRLLLQNTPVYPD